MLAVHDNQMPALFDFTYRDQLPVTPAKDALRLKDRFQDF
jgi:hypothetical protein